MKADNTISFRFISLTTIYLLVMTPNWAQEDSPFRWGGYLKNMQTVLLPGNDLVLMENLVHQRINFRWNTGEKTYFTAGLRNRIFSGNLTAITPNFGQMIQDFSDDWLPMSVVWIDRSQYIIHSTLDRFYFDWSSGQWNIRAGRQRINWGINLAFNPNDLFNAYNFLDFDYEERPGADAVRIKYYYSFASGFDIAVKGASSLDEFTGAVRWFTNYKGYDFQWITGLSFGDVAFGGGWAGSIKDSGWKGEWTVFIPVVGEDRTTAFSVTTGWDFIFGKGWTMYASYLFNSDASGSLQNVLLQNRPLTARNLFPFRHNILSQVSWPVTPLISLSSAFIYSIASDHPLVVNPTLSISMAQNWDLDLIGQTFSTLKGNPDRFTNHLIFLRLRWSY